MRNRVDFDAITEEGDAMRTVTTTGKNKIGKFPRALQVCALVLSGVLLQSCGVAVEGLAQKAEPVYSYNTNANSGLVPLNAVSRMDMAAAKSPAATATPMPVRAAMVASVSTPTPAPSPLPRATGSKAPATLSLSMNPGLPAAGSTPVGGDDFRLQTITPDLIAKLKSEAPNAEWMVRKLVAQPSEYRIGVGDVLSVAVWGYPEMSMSTMGSSGGASVGAGAGGADGGATGNVGYLVSAGGYIQFPYVGEVYVSGLTESEAYTKLTSALSRVIRNPQITVRVQNFRSQRVYVAGEVRTPGIYSITDLPMTLPEAISRAGGALPTADLSRIQLNRNGKNYILDMSALIASGVNPAGILLAAGDMLRVPSRDDSKVYVIGEVQKPSALPMQNGRLSLNQALGEAAGVSPITGNARQVYVVRTRSDGQGQPAVYHIDVQAPAALILAEQFALQAGDVVYVDASALATWNRVISLILPSAGLITTSQYIHNNN